MIEISQSSQMALQLAADNCQGAVVKLLLEKGVDPNSQSGQIALQLAEKNGHEAVIVLLTEMSVEKFTLRRIT